MWWCAVCVCATGLIMHGSTICAVSTFLFSLGCSICAEYHLHLIKVGFLDDALGLLCCRYTKGQICQKYKKNSNMIVIDMGYALSNSYLAFLMKIFPHLKLILHANKPQNQMCDWNQKCFRFVLQNFKSIFSI